MTAARLDPISFAIIPARAGSSRVADKNLLTVGDKSLIARAIESADPCDYVIVTTDYSFDRLMAEPSTRAEIERTSATGRFVYHRRPDYLCGPRVQLESVMLDALTWFRDHAVVGCVQEDDVLVLLQPTSPLRCKVDVAGALDLFEERDALFPHGDKAAVRRTRSVVSTTLMDAGPAAYFAGVMNGSFWEPFNPLKRPGTADLSRVYTSNGAIFITTIGALVETNTRMPEPIRGFVMPSHRSVDVDSDDDLAKARSAAAVE